MSDQYPPQYYHTAPSSNDQVPVQPHAQDYGYGNAKPGLPIVSQPLIQHQPPQYYVVPDGKSAYSAYSQYAYPQIAQPTTRNHPEAQQNPYLAGGYQSQAQFPVQAVPAIQQHQYPFLPEHQNGLYEQTAANISYPGTYTSHNVQVSHEGVPYRSQGTHSPVTPLSPPPSYEQPAASTSQYGHAVQYNNVPQHHNGHQFSSNAYVNQTNSAVQVIHTVPAPFMPQSAVINQSNTTQAPDIGNEKSPETNFVGAKPPSSFSKHMRAATNWGNSKLKIADHMANNKVVHNWTGAVYQGAKGQFQEQMVNPEKKPAQVQRSVSSQPQLVNPNENQKVDLPQINYQSYAQHTPASQSQTQVYDQKPMITETTHQWGGPTMANPESCQYNIGPAHDSDTKVNPSIASNQVPGNNISRSSIPPLIQSVSSPQFQSEHMSHSQTSISRKPVGRKPLPGQPEIQQQPTQRSKDDSALLSAPSSLPTRPVTSHDSAPVKPKSVKVAEKVGAGLGKATKSTSAFLKTPTGKVVIATTAIALTAVTGIGLGALVGLAASGVSGLGSGDGGSSVVDDVGSQPVSEDVSGSGPVSDSTSVDPSGGDNVVVDSGSSEATNVSSEPLADATALADHQTYENAYSGEVMNSVGNDFTVAESNDPVATSSTDMGAI